jgi:hypothetical protein
MSISTEDPPGEHRHGRSASAEGIAHREQAAPEEPQAQAAEHEEVQEVTVQCSVEILGGEPAFREGEAPAEPSCPSESPTPGSAGASPSRGDLAVIGVFNKATVRDGAISKYRLFRVRNSRGFA